MILQEFRKFAIRGNIADLAAGIVIGAAFNGVVNSFVNDILMPPIGLLVGKVDFTNHFINLSPHHHYDALAAAKAAGAPTLNYGLFINQILNFLIVAFAVFLVVRELNKVSTSIFGPAPTPATTKECPYCASTIPLKAVRCAYCTSQLQVA
jgi:large conductance mechanosensitive channel